MSTPRVYVGCLGCYNNGYHSGEWFDADCAPENVAEWDSHAWRPVLGLNAPGLRLHVVEGHEELWCFDHENFHGLLAGECSPATARELAAVLEHQASNAEAFAAFVRNVYGDTPTGDDLTSAEHEFADAYCGDWESEREYAMDLADELGAIPQDYTWPVSCIDWEQATRELFMDYYSAPAPDGRVYVFRSV